MNLSELATKYMHILGVVGPMPVFNVRDNLGKTWLAQCQCRFINDGRAAGRITIQKMAMGNPETLERLIAHEMIHYAECIEVMYGRRSVNQYRLDRRFDKGHGPFFRSGMALINAVKGPGYVTVKSDTTFKLAVEVKPYYIVIVPRGGDRGLAWMWSVRISEQLRPYVAKIVQFNGARVFRISDPYFTNNARKINNKGKFTAPVKGTENETKLNDIWNSGTELKIS